MSRKAVTSISIILLGIVAVIFWPVISAMISAENERPRGGGRPPTSVTTMKIDSSALRSTVIANGSLRAADEIAVQPETSGRIIELNIQDGAFVEKGELLVKLDDAPLRAELAAIRADRDLAQRTLRRQEDLLSRNAVPQETFDAARSRLEILEAQIDLIEARIDRTEIRAPFSGRLGLRETSLGAFVGPGDILTTLQSEEVLHVDFTVPERYQERIPIETIIQLDLRGFTTPFTGTVFARAPRIDPDTRTLRLRAEVPNPDGRLLPGSFARVTIPIEEFPEALMIPAISVLRDEATAYVFLVDEDGRAKRRDISVGIRTRDEVQVLDGLRSGDHLIVRGGHSLSDGSPIRIIERDMGIGAVRGL